MGINAIKAGRVNLVGISYKRHRGLSQRRWSFLVLCVFCPGPGDMQNLSVSFSHFPVNKSVCLGSVRRSAWKRNPVVFSFQCTHCIFVRGKLLCSGKCVVDTLGWQMWVTVTHKTMCAGEKSNEAPWFTKMHSRSLAPPGTKQTHLSC